MLTVDEIVATIDSIERKQTERLEYTEESLSAFLSRPEEMAVSFELDCYEAMLKKLLK